MLRKIKHILHKYCAILQNLNLIPETDCISLLTLQVESAQREEDRDKSLEQDVMIEER